MSRHACCRERQRKYIANEPNVRQSRFADAPGSQAAYLAEKRLIWIDMILEVSRHCSQYISSQTRRVAELREDLVEEGRRRRLLYDERKWAAQSELRRVLAERAAVREKEGMLRLLLQVSILGCHVFVVGVAELGSKLTMLRLVSLAVGIGLFDHPLLVVRVAPTSRALTHKETLTFRFFVHGYTKDAHH